MLCLYLCSPNVQLIWIAHVLASKSVVGLGSRKSTPIHVIRSFINICHRLETKKKKVS